MVAIVFHLVLLRAIFRSASRGHREYFDVKKDAFDGNDIVTVDKVYVDAPPEEVLLLAQTGLLAMQPKCVC